MRYFAYVIWILLFSSTQGLPADLWTPEPLMQNARSGHTATLLTSGQLLVAGGMNSSAGWLTNAELFFPGSGIWTNTGPLNNKRDNHTATLLQNGQVLVAGGSYGATNAMLASAEIYDPLAGRWAITGGLTFPRELHTATLLLNGQVLVTGGFDGSNYLSSAEIYDPGSGQWTLTGSMQQARANHSATLMGDGTVLVAGGYNGTNSLTCVEEFDPATGIWSEENPLNLDRMSQTATRLLDGTVLVVGGSGSNNIASLQSAEIYDPASGNWSLTASIGSSWEYHTASLLPNGKVLVCGGVNGNGVALYSPALGTWTNSRALLHNSRQSHSATLLPGGRVLVAGGRFPAGVATSSVEMYDYASGSWTTNSLWTTNVFVGPMVLLPNGNVLAPGGLIEGPQESYYLGIAAVQTYSPDTGSWTAANPMNYARGGHSATLLPNGKVLVAGGDSYSGNVFPNLSIPVTNSEIFDPQSGTWSVAGPLNYPRSNHTATLLADGKVLVAGGNVSNCELFDPATGLWSLTGSMLRANISLYSATLLPSGKVLAIGSSDVELYTPVTGAWTTVTNFYALPGQSVTLLPSGKILAAGGESSQNSIVSQADLYDPTTGLWTNTGSMIYPHGWHQAVLLPSGRVLVAGGYANPNPILNQYSTFTELYDPASGTWSLAGSLKAACSGRAGVFLANGQFLFAEGTNLDMTELFDPGIGYSTASQPQITSIGSAINLGSSLVVTGSQFFGGAEGSGGNGSQNSASGNPMLQLRSMQTGQTTFLPAANFGTHTFASLPVVGFPPGYAMATVFVSGIPSPASTLNIAAPTPLIFDLHKLSSKSLLTNGAYQISSYYYPGATLGVKYITSLPSPPLINWSKIGTMTESSPGTYQFTDLFYGKNHAQGFYSVQAQ